MRTSRLQLRGLPMIVAAYAIAPPVAVGIAWLAWYGPFASPLNSAWPIGKTGAWQLMMLAGTPICLVIEFMVATPLLFGFRRWRWGWLNGWSACGIGFLLAYLPVFAIDAVAPAAGNVVNGAVYAANGSRTLAGWISLAGGDAPWGVTGLAVALVFRLLAVRTVTVETPPATP